MTTPEELSRQIAALDGSMRVEFQKLAGRLEVFEERHDGLRTEMNQKLLLVDERIGTLRRDVDRLDGKTSRALDDIGEDLSDSKIHRIDELNKQIETLKSGKRDSVIWWKRQSVLWIVGVVSGITLLLVGTGLGLLVKSLFH